MNSYSHEKSKRILKMQKKCMTIGNFCLEKGIIEAYTTSPLCYVMRYIVCSYLMIQSLYKAYFANESLIKPYLLSSNHPCNNPNVTAFGPPSIFI